MIRTLRLPALLTMFLALTLAACGSDDDQGTTGNAASKRSTIASGGPEPGAFPVTIAHRYGHTTIASEPQRVVVAGLREQDALLSLGVDPVATTEWYGGHPGAIFPWAKAALGDQP